MLDVTALVLAGGKSSRMGRDKLLLELDGQSLIARACAFAKSLGGSVLVASGNEAHFETLPSGCAAVYDAIGGQGPIAGLSAGLSAAETEFVLAFAADMPHPSLGAARLLRSEIGDADVCLFRKDGKLEPLFALYRTRCAAKAAADLEAGQLRLTALIASLDARILDTDDGSLFLNLNTPEDYESACRQVKAHE